MTDQATEPQIYMDLSRFRVPPGFRGRSAWVVQLWWIVQSLLIHTTPQFMYGWRRFLWRLFGAKIGEGVLIRPSARVTYPWKVAIGKHSWIGDRVELYSLGRIEVGSNVVVSQDTYLCAATHDHDKPDFPLVAKTIHIEDQVWIAAGCFVAAGITVGRGAILGARSVALRDIPVAAICAGHPAKVLKMRAERR